MLAVILAGGLGTRLAEETQRKPKPLVEIGEMPIIWHIMKNLHVSGFSRFIILTGYKSNLIKNFFLQYSSYGSDLTIQTKSNSVKFYDKHVEDWEVTILDTGYSTMTGGRLLRAASFLPDNEPFLFTYGDGLSDVNIPKLLACHMKSKKMVTVTAVRPQSRFGALDISQTGEVLGFEEKPANEVGLINGGFFVMDKNVLEYINDDTSVWEDQPMSKLVQERQLNAYVHDSFWQPMDTLREKQKLESLWSSGQAPWKNW
ncbi:glucose-1-phosphate cytidylyltransferase [Amylibacter sp.]|jgi:glucose-1-phosphate cytidylyltransferase|nr:glucose-1-phosphate cytidylyltransferase [Amylibacter sp.]